MVASVPASIFRSNTLPRGIMVHAIPTLGLPALLAAVSRPFRFRQEIHGTESSSPSPLGRTLLKWPGGAVRGQNEKVVIRAVHGSQPRLVGLPQRPSHPCGPEHIIATHAGVAFAAEVKRFVRRVEGTPRPHPQ